MVAAGAGDAGAATAPPAGAPLKATPNPAYRVADAPTKMDAATTYNNFYEFGTNKDDPARLAASLKPRPWHVQVDGLCAKPTTFDIEEILKIAPLEERIYALRCVEAWSMVIPWIGYSLAALLKKVEPTGQAKYVEFTTLKDPEQFPGQKAGFFGGSLDWPYTEGLRLDEAMHPLTLLTVGMYGTGAAQPERRADPGRHSLEVRLQERQVDRAHPAHRHRAQTAWNKAAPQEYGFYSNVNPAVDHPRWSQGTERRIGEFRRRQTLPFNGYADQVASLYSGMDLKKNF